jgi:hypothetical protein
MACESRYLILQTTLWTRDDDRPHRLLHILIHEFVVAHGVTIKDTAHNQQEPRNFQDPVSPKGVADLPLPAAHSSRTIELTRIQPDHQSHRFAFPPTIHSFPTHNNALANPAATPARRATDNAAVSGRQIWKNWPFGQKNARTETPFK